jgi:hypothetical protein
MQYNRIRTYSEVKREVDLQIHRRGTGDGTL